MICPKKTLRHITYWPRIDLAKVGHFLKRKPSVGRGLKFFIFRPYGFENLGFLTNARRDAMRSKNSMGLLQGPRLMAWTTKSPIPRNHWVPIGCWALLVSVKQLEGKKIKFP